MENKIDLRIGSGLAPIKPGEVQQVIIAGMGGNLIRDIIVDGMEVFKKSDALILQPMKNSEVLREYIYKNGFKIVDEELCIDENKFYEIIKIRYDNEKQEVDSIFYEIGKALVDKKHKLLLKFVESKIESYNKIILNIKDNTELARRRKEDLYNKIKKLQELIECI